MAIEPQPLRSQSAADVAPPPGRLDAAAFARDLDDHIERVYAFVARRAADRSGAEELTALAFNRALRGGRSGDPDRFSGLIYRTAANALVDRARRARRHIPPGVRAADLDEGDEDRWSAEAISDEAASRALAAAIDGDLLRRAIQRVPDMHLHVIVLSYFDALDPDEIGAALGCSTMEVALRLNRALGAVRSAMADPVGRPEARLHLVGAEPDPIEATGAIIDADLVRLDVELRAAGRQAERALHGRTQPTRWFSQELRARLLADYVDQAGRG
jgi:RNA polymerase sigma factor (sigma-70 family)